MPRKTLCILGHRVIPRHTHGLASMACRLQPLIHPHILLTFARMIIFLGVNVKGFKVTTHPIHPPNFLMLTENPLIMNDVKVIQRALMPTLPERDGLGAQEAILD